MPCSDGGPSYTRNEIETARESTTRAKGRIDELEAMLCSACRVLTRFEYDFDENPALSVWWDKHKAQDAVKALKEKRELLRKALIVQRIDELSDKKLSELNNADIQFLKEHKIL